MKANLHQCMSHEISHVTQRHIARQIGDNVPNTIQGGSSALRRCATECYFR